MIIIIIIEKSGSATITTHSQPPIPKGREKGEFFFFFFFFFSAYKNVKSFYTGKIAKKNAFCLWHVRPFILLFMAYAEPVYSSFRTPTLPYRAQPLLNATGKMFLNWGLYCSSICSMHAPAEFWTRNRMNNEIWIKKINTGNHEFFREPNTCIWSNDVTLYFFGSVKGFC